MPPRLAAAGSRFRFRVVTWAELSALACRLPGVVPAVSYGEPSLKYRHHLISRLRVADQSVVLLDVPAPEREMLLVADPETYFLEPHYSSHDIVLARLATLSPGSAGAFVQRRWTAVAPKRLVQRWQSDRSDQAACSVLTDRSD